MNQEKNQAEKAAEEIVENAEQAVAQDTDPKPHTASEREDLEQAAQQNADGNAQALQAELDNAQEKLLRLTAEMDNLRRRASRDQENARKYGAKKLLEDLLPVADSFDQASAAAKQDNTTIDSVMEGMDLTQKMLLSTLERHGVETIKPQKGEAFNPEFHEAMSMLPANDEVPGDHIFDVIQTGFKLHERVVRPARVIVAKGD